MNRAELKAEGWIFPETPEAMELTLALRPFKDGDEFIMKNPAGAMFPENCDGRRFVLKASHRTDMLSSSLPDGWRPTIGVVAEEFVNWVITANQVLAWRRGEHHLPDAD